ncbi:hypothetical protein C0J52_16733 [Blattella germanica]|nr:hypothetical protein C0J52_16733 [Blattella germanica]
MTFYMKPPRGNTALHILHKCVKQRFDFLLSLRNGTMIIPTDFEYLLDGTPMDRAGHFLLRLLSLSSSNFSEFFFKAETDFFVIRLSMMNYKGVINMLKIVYKHTSEILERLSSDSLKYSQFLFTVKKICKNLIQVEKAVHTFNEAHPENCTNYSVSVPFTMCLPLVRNREVEMKYGNCIVPCGRWKSLLKIMFQLHLKFGMKHLQTTGCFQQALDDSRIFRLAKELDRRCKDDNKYGADSNSLLKANDVAKESEHFPLCMVHLYQTLQSRHRLSHEARRQFTLFLKDAGMPIEEALIFWEKEYSQISNGCGSGCTHSWQKDARRYRYSIRHMYGLEGGRYTYRVASCAAIQNTHLTPTADGGCPFQHFDTSNMINLLSTQAKGDEAILNEIIRLKENGKPLEACHFYNSLQQNSSERNCKCSGKFSNPLQYYLQLKKEAYKLEPYENNS